MKKLTIVLAIVAILLPFSSSLTAQTYYYKGDSTPKITMTEIRLPQDWVAKLDTYSQDQLLLIKSNLLLNLAKDYKDLAEAKDQELVDSIIQIIIRKEKLLKITEDYIK